MAKSSAISSPCLARAATSRAEVLERAELGMDRVVPALRRADRIGAADDRPAPARQAVVAALAVRRADRMDRREIEHVEAHVADRGQARDHVVEGAVPRRIVGLRAREHLVPGGEACRLALDLERQRFVPC